MTAGWYADPTGRFPARYFDGTDWTDQVQGADGQVSTDAVERRSTGLPAPGPAGGSGPGGYAAAPAWGSPQPASAGGWGGPAPAQGGGWSPGPGPAHAGPTTLERSSGTIGLVIAAIGWALAALSLFALDWVDGGTRGDITDGLPDSLPDGAPLADALSFGYLKGADLLLLGVVAVGLVIVFATLRGKDPTAPRLLVGLVAALAVVLHAVTVARLLSDQAEFGAQLGLVAYLVVILGLAIGSRSRPAPA